MNLFTKYFSEEIPIGLSFENVMDFPDAIASVEIKAYEMPLMTDVSDAIISRYEIQDQICKFVVKGGVSKKRYRIIVKARSVSAYKYEGYVDMSIW